MPPFDLDCDDSDFRAYLSEEQLERLERRQIPARVGVSNVPVRRVGVDRGRLEQQRLAAPPRAAEERCK